MKPRLIILLGLGVGAVIGLAAVVLIPLFFSTPQGIFSSSAVLSNGPLEISAPFAGKLDFVADSGAKLKKGEALAVLDEQPLRAALAEAEQAANAQVGALDPRAVALIRAYRAIGETSQELEELLGSALLKAEEMTGKISDLAVRHGQMQLELRALEIKAGEGAKREDRLKALAVEEELTGQALALAREERDKLQLERYALEKRLAEKMRLENAIKRIPPQEMEKYGHLEEAFNQVEAAEKALQASRVAAPADGSVLLSYAQAGQEAAPGQLLLLFLPDAESANPLWITAYFRPEDAAKLTPGALCRVAMEVELPEVLEGRLHGPLPLAAPEKSADGQALAAPGKAYQVVLNPQPLQISRELRAGYRAWVRIPD
ncbi:hypothetical protein LJC36_00445 [Desulfovibrio sp. OttesenSCG-928-C14]|nr:hypothetical protein [Desulfovibrio sp. OttesenSCG-928-C14]